MEIKIHTVGHIVDGIKYKDWYVFVQTYHENYLVLISNNRHFGKDDNGKLLEGREGYDDWCENWDSLEYYFTYQQWQIEWLDWRPKHLVNPIPK